MKRIAALALAAVMSLSLLAGCGGTVTAPSSIAEEEPEPMADLIASTDKMTVLLPYGVSKKVIRDNEEAFGAAVKKEMRRRGWEIGEVALKAANTRADSGKALDDGTADVIIMPANQYFTYGEDAFLLMTATRPGCSVKTMEPKDWNGSLEPPAYTAEDCPYGRTLICATQSDKGKALAEASKNGTLTWDMVQDAVWMYPKYESQSGFCYPELWLRKTFDKTMNDLPETVAVDGYGALFAEAGLGGADIIVIEADRRIDYAHVWTLPEEELDYTGKRGMGHEDSIFNEVRVIGVTNEIYGDAMVLRSEELPFTDYAFQIALKETLQELEKNPAARAIWESCGYTGFIESEDFDYNNIRDLPVIGLED